MSSPNSNAEPLSPDTADGGLATVAAVPEAAAMVALPPPAAADEQLLQAQASNFVRRHDEVLGQLFYLLNDIPCLSVLKEVPIYRQHMETKRLMYRRLDLLVFDASSGTLYVFEVGCSSNVARDVRSRVNRYEVEVQLLQLMYPTLKVHYRVFVVSDNTSARKIHLKSLKQLLVFVMTPVPLPSGLISFEADDDTLEKVRQFLNQTMNVVQEGNLAYTDCEGQLRTRSLFGDLREKSQVNVGIGNDCYLFAADADKRYRMLEMWGDVKLLREMDESADGVNPIAELVEKGSVTRMVQAWQESQERRQVRGSGGDDSTEQGVLAHEEDDAAEVETETEPY